MKRISLIAILICFMTCVIVDSVQADNRTQFVGISGPIPLMGTPESRADQNAKFDAAYKIFLQGQMAQESGDWDQAIAYFNQCSPVDYIPELIKIQTAKHDFEIGDYPSSLDLFDSCAIWANGHVQGLESDDEMIYAFLLMNAGKSAKALEVYQDAYPWFATQGLSDDVNPMPIIDFTNDNPPLSSAQFESMALTAAAHSMTVGFGGSMTTIFDGKAFTPNDPYVNSYKTKVSLQRINLALQFQPTSAYAYYMLGKYYKHIPGRENDTVEAFHKAWENGDNNMEQRVMNERASSSSDAFKKAFDDRFKDTPGHPDPGPQVRVLGTF